MGSIETAALPRGEKAGLLSLGRLTRSAVVWTWGFNGLRLASGIILLPIVLSVLSREDLGMYYVLISLNALGPLMDFGLLNATQRAVGYGMAGAKELLVFGVPTPDQTGTEPNYPLLWRLLATTRTLYRYLALVVFVVLGGAGTIFLHSQVAETSSPVLTWWAWAATVVGTGVELYSNWWTAFLRGMNEVLVTARIQVIVYAARVGLAAALLFNGAGLLSLPLAGLITAVLMRELCRRQTLKSLPKSAASKCARDEIMALLRILWPNSWRVGLQFLSAYLTSSASALLCSKILGLAANAQYGLSVQIMFFVYGMALVWTSVKWPIISQYQARGDLNTVRKLLWMRLWLQNITFVLMAAILVCFAPEILKLLGSGKTVLPREWLSLLAVLTFLEMQFSAWGSLIATGNRMPFLRSTVLTHVSGVVISVLLVSFSPLAAGSFILGPLLSGCAFYFWYWPREGARTLGTTWSKFMFSRP